MEVILLEAVDSLGEPGALVKVRSGYARNFLFPRHLALPASSANRRVFQERRRVLEKRDIAAMAAAKAAAGKIETVSCTISVKVGEEDKLYGSVGTADIARQLAEQGYEIDRRQIHLDEPIRKLGVYTVDIKLHREVSVPIKVWVVKQ